MDKQHLIRHNSGKAEKMLILDAIFPLVEVTLEEMEKLEYVFPLVCLPRPGVLPPSPRELISNTEPRILTTRPVRFFIKTARIIESPPPSRAGTMRV
ncbi:MULTISPECIES: hypothetical protein [unclassified Paenibacillus]|uniref:hypothetical protein n=1 Tax=unclassified Paenibacillus TaxID=185978 RepID=UPI00117D6C16|nr:MULTISPECIES: hypothetical protein [unclassified Paenibacillus]